MSDDVITKVQDVLVELFNVGRQSVSLETKANDIAEWDSVGHLSLWGVLEEAFEIHFNIGDFAEVDSVRAIVSLIEAKKALTSLSSAER